MDDPSYIQYAKTYRRERLKSCAKALGLGIAGYVLFAWVLFPFGACGCKSLGVARRASCESNMKQLGVALSQYTQDNDGDLPPITQPSAKATWREAVYPFVRNTDVYRCPDDSSDRSLDSATHLPQSYGANSVDWNKHFPAGRSIALVDMDGYHGPDWNMGNPAFLPASGRELHAHLPNHAFYQRPAGMLNCLFTDGHVKALKPMSTLTPVNLWTRDNAPFTGQQLSNAQAILHHAEDTQRMSNRPNVRQRLLSC